MFMIRGGGRLFLLGLQLLLLVSVGFQLSSVVVVRAMPVPPKNLVLLSDGTGMQIKGWKKNSNVLRLFRMLEKGHLNEQRVLYNPGIGTVRQTNPWSQLQTNLAKFFGLATGHGLDEDVLSFYQFLMEHYNEGDHIYMFGFSRGAYTMRVLAGFIHLAGILHKDQANLLPYAYVAYKEAGNSSGRKPKKDEKYNIDAEQEVLRIGELADSRMDATIHFVGLWDTVNSVMVPRPDRCWGLVPSMQMLPYTRANPSVTHFRHACAIDERRRMFRLSKWLWGNDSRGTMYPATKNNDHNPKPRLCTAKQVWFPGCHGDVGGGWAEEKSGLAKNALIWMVDEAKKVSKFTSQKLLIDDELYDKIALGIEKEGGSGKLLLGNNENATFSKPDPLGEINNSMQIGWKPMEIFPKYHGKKEWNGRFSFLRLFYIPWGEPRRIPVDQDLHDSVIDRMKGDTKYRPPNVLEYLQSTKRAIPDVFEPTTNTTTAGKPLYLSKDQK